MICELLLEDERKKKNPGKMEINHVSSDPGRNNTRERKTDEVKGKKQD